MPHLCPQREPTNGRQEVTRSGRRLRSAGCGGMGAADVAETAAGVVDTFDKTGVMDPGLLEGPLPKRSRTTRASEASRLRPPAPKKSNIGLGDLDQVLWLEVSTMPYRTKIPFLLCDALYSF